MFGVLCRRDPCGCGHLLGWCLDRALVDVEFVAQPLSNLSICLSIDLSICLCISYYAYAILYYTIIYYTILYYTILYYIILYYTIIYYTTLYYTTRRILHYTVRHYTMSCYVCHAMRCCTILGSAMLHYITQKYTELCSGLPAKDLFLQLAHPALRQSFWLRFFSQTFAIVWHLSASADSIICRPP